MKKLHMLMMIGAAVVAVGAVFHAEGGEFCTHFRPNSKNCLYKTGETAVVEVSFADKAGNSLKSGVVDVWADDGWTNIVWRRKVDLAKELQPVRMELSRSTPGSLRIRAKGCDCPVRAQMDRVLFGVDEINPLTPCPADFEAYWRGEQKRLERGVRGLSGRRAALLFQNRISDNGLRPRPSRNPIFNLSTFQLTSERQ